MSLAPPAQQTYVISFPNGGSGNLVKALLERVVLAYKPFGEFVTNDVNSAHPTSEWANYSLDTTARITDPKSEFLATQLTDPTKTAFVATHFFDPDVIRAKFPGCKMLVITHTEADIEEITINWLYKHITLSENGGLIFTNFSVYTPTPWVGLNNKDFRTFSAAEKLQTVKFFNGSTINYGFHLLGDLSTFGDDVVELSYRDLVTSPPAVWTAVKTLTGMPPTTVAITALTYYQEKQALFMARVREELGL
jgi:hypothetical protein